MSQVVNRRTFCQMCVPRTELRLFLLSFAKKHDIAISTLVTTSIVVTAVSGFVIELNKTCSPDLKFWIIVLCFRLTMRISVRLYVEAVMHDYIRHHGDMHVFTKITEVLDVFGMVWFAVGNLLILNNFACSKIAPINYYVGLTYILGSYASYVLPFLIHLSLKICRSRQASEEASAAATLLGGRDGGRGAEDRDMLLMRSYADRYYARHAERRHQELQHQALMRTALRSHPSYASPTGLFSSYSLSPEQCFFWKLWLSRYRCEEIDFALFQEYELHDLKDRILKQYELRQLHRRRQQQLLQLQQIQGEQRQQQQQQQRDTTSSSSSSATVVPLSGNDSCIENDLQVTDLSADDARDPILAYTEGALADLGTLSGPHIDPTASSARLSPDNPGLQFISNSHFLCANAKYLELQDVNTLLSALETLRSLGTCSICLQDFGYPIPARPLSSSPSPPSAAPSPAAAAAAAYSSHLSSQSLPYGRMEIQFNSTDDRSQSYDSSSGLLGISSGVPTSTGNTVYNNSIDDSINNSSNNNNNNNININNNNNNNTSANPSPEEQEEDATVLDSLVVRYPCSSQRHYFHAFCLYNWLHSQTESIRRAGVNNYSYLRVLPPDTAAPVVCTRQLSPVARRGNNSASVRGVAASLNTQQQQQQEQQQEQQQQQQQVHPIVTGSSHAQRLREVHRQALANLGLQENDLSPALRSTASSLTPSQRSGADSGALYDIENPPFSEENAFPAPRSSPSINSSDNSSTIIDTQIEGIRARNIENGAIAGLQNAHQQQQQRERQREEEDEDEMARVDSSLITLRLNHITSTAICRCVSCPNCREGPPPLAQYHAVPHISNSPYSIPGRPRSSSTRIGLRGPISSREEEFRAFVGNENAIFWEATAAAAVRRTDN